MLEAKVINNNDGLYVELPMVQPTGKVRVKERSFFSEYGRPIATKQTNITPSCYVEWQIGYDLLKNEDNGSKTSLKDLSFVNYKGETKYLYELCEILFYAHKNNLISLKEIKEAYENIINVSPDDTFEQMDSICITRTDPKETQINSLSFYKMTVSYPLLVHKFADYEIFAEIVIKEKQRAVGTQAMLYVCLPITSLHFETDAMGRTLKTKEIAKWFIGAQEASLALEMFKIFGMLSPKHRHDVIEIFKAMFGYCLDKQ